MPTAVSLLVLFLSVSCHGGPVDSESPSPEKATADSQTGRQLGKVEESLVEKLNGKCAERDPSSCAMLKIVAYMNRMLKKASIDVADNIRITQSSVVQETSDDLPRSMSQQSDIMQVANLMTAKLQSFVRSRELRLRILPDLDAVVTSNPDADGNLNLGVNLEKVSVEEGRGKKQMGGLMAAMAMKMGMMAAMAFKALVLLVGKALIVSKIALVLAVIIGLKKLLSHKKHVTYEVVAAPHHSHVEHIDHGHGHESYSSGWGRSSDLLRSEALRKAYRGHIPK